jgi:phage tail sheath protein FI
MTVSTSCPGIYVQEVPSAVRTITGVATSVAAFVGSARRGPVNTATFISGYADFERTFGGLWAESTMSGAVRDFFANGGGQAVIVRLVRAGASCAELGVPPAVWKGPAGTGATLSGVTDLTVLMTDGDEGRLNPLGVNCLRSFPNTGRVAWGARTLRDADGGRLRIDAPIRERPEAETTAGRGVNAT